jgi:DNA polymerase I
MDTLILIDGHALAYRMYFALERTNMRTQGGQPTWAAYGFYNALFSLLKSHRPEAMAVAFDVGKETFRNTLYPAYKANRESMPDDLKAQMEAIRLGVQRLGLPVFEKNGYEADDVLGTLVTQAANAGYHVQILTGDQDAFQLVEDVNPDKPDRGSIEVLIPSRMPKEPLKHYNRQAVFDKWGVYPEQVIDFKGLKGDTSDNIPGVPGVGDKTAARLLAQYTTMETLYHRIDELPRNKMREKLETFKEQAFLSKQLATICREVPIAFDLSSCVLKTPDISAVMDYFNTMEFKAFIRQAPELLALFAPGGLGDNGNSAIVETQQLLMETSSKPMVVEHTLVTTQTQLNQLVSEILDARVFAIDLETTGLDVQTAKLVGIAISVACGMAIVPSATVNCFRLQNSPASVNTLAQKTAGSSWDDVPVPTCYIPLEHPDLQTELNEALVLAALKPLLTAPDIAKLVHNAKFEYNMFRQNNIEMQGVIIDTMLASYLDKPEGKHGLKALSEVVLNQTMTEIKTLIGRGKQEILFSGVPLQEAAAYASCDTYATVLLTRHFLSVLDATQWALFYEIEMPLALVLADMEWAGISLDRDYLANLSKQLEKRLATIEQEIYQLTEETFNLNSPKQVATVLFEKLQIAPSRKTKGKTAYSTDVKVLEQLTDTHPVVPLLLEHRQLFKLKSTYIDALPELIHPGTGRIHTHFNQTVTATGRLSSSNPNLQNIPIRSDLGRQIRQAFIPPQKTGWCLLAADYSQIELRFLAHFSEDPNLVAAFQNGEDIHTATASLVFGMAPDKVSKTQRYQAKTVNFGVIYGQSPYGLAQQLKISQREASDFIQLYFSRYRQVRLFIETIKSQARETGMVHTICGRVRNLTMALNSSNRSEREFAERAAFNTPLQGSAADLMKVAMIQLQAALKAENLKSRLLLQVHDELVLEVCDEERERVKALVESSMMLEQPLKVPLVVDMYEGSSWMEV